MINIPHPLFSTAFCASTENKEISMMMMEMMMMAMMMMAMMMIKQDDDDQTR
jgi:hypothetical protein